MPTTQPRKLHFETVHCVRGRVAFDTSGAPVGVEIGHIPAGSFVLPATVKVETAFNGTGAAVDVGSAAVAAGFAASAGIAPAATGVKTALTGTLSGNITADTPVLVKVTPGSPPNTTGLIDVIVPFYPHAA